MEEIPEISVVRVPLTDNELKEIEEALTNPVEMETKNAAVEATVEKIEEIERSAKTLTEIYEQLTRRLGNGTIAITSTNRLDGVGAQALAKISAQIMALALKQKYAHASFERLEHRDEHIRLTEFCERWDKKLQLSGNSESIKRFPFIHNLCTSTAPVTSELLNQSFEVGHLYCFRDCHSFTEKYRAELRDVWATVITDLRTRYYGGKTQYESKETGNSCLRVAVHIRRGDVQKNNISTAKRWMSLDYYAKAMRTLVANHPGHEFFFNVVSEGVDADFKELTDEFSNVKLLITEPSSNMRSNVSGHQRTRPQAGMGISRNQHLLNLRRPQQARFVAPHQRNTVAKKGPDSFEAFETLVGADILIMSRSAFSYLAGLYSKNIKIYPPDMWLSVPLWCEESDGWYTDVNDVSLGGADGDSDRPDLSNEAPEA